MSLRPAALTPPLDAPSSDTPARRLAAVLAAGLRSGVVAPAPAPATGTYTVEYYDASDGTALADKPKQRTDDDGTVTQYYYYDDGVAKQKNVSRTNDGAVLREVTKYDPTGAKTTETLIRKYLTPPRLAPYGPGGVTPLTRKVYAGSVGQERQTEDVTFNMQYGGDFTAWHYEPTTRKLLRMGFYRSNFITDSDVGKPYEELVYRKEDVPADSQPVVWYRVDYITPSTAKVLTYKSGPLEGQEHHYRAFTGYSEMQRYKTVFPRTRNGEQMKRFYDMTRPDFPKTREEYYKRAELVVTISFKGAKGQEVEYERTPSNAEIPADFRSASSLGRQNSVASRDKRQGERSPRSPSRDARQRTGATGKACVAEGEDMAAFFSEDDDE